MKDADKRKVYCFVDESGDPIFFNKKGKDLVSSGDASPVFIVGYLEIEDPGMISKILNKLKEEIRNDEYLKSIPSVSKSLLHFHAKDDCPEIREKIYKAVKEIELKTFVIVARKDTHQFVNKFKGNAASLYEHLVEKLFENRLHLYSDIDIYFSKMGNIVREKNMKSSIEKATNIFMKKWGRKVESNVRIFIQEPSQIAGLQIIDYLLWAVFRVYVKGEMRYYDFIKEKYSLIVDIFDTKKYPKIFYSKDNPLDINKISPLIAR